MNQTRKFDVIVIGAGQGGIPLALAFAEDGQETALVERSHVGGSCINTGCTPTKTMLASARVAHLARRAGDYGVLVDRVDVDLAAVRSRKDEMVRSFRESNLDRIRSAGVKLIRGEARFLGPKVLAVDGESGKADQITGGKIFIDTGARPRIPDLKGLDNVPYLNSTTIMDLTEVPEHLVILGGGYVGVEFGQMFRRFGSDVTILEVRPQLLGHEDPDVAKAIADIFEEDGIEIRLEVEPVQVRKEKGRIYIRLQTKEKEEVEVSGSHLLVAAGRIPAIEALNLEAVGIETDESGAIRTDDRLETTVSGVYALGDVKGGPAFTHISYDDYRVLRANLLEGGGESVRGRLVPYTVFTDPQLGRIGLTEKQAQEKGVPYRLAKMPMRRVSRALEIDRPRGLMKVLVHPDTGRILGAAILAVQGGEMMSLLEVAMMGDLPYTALRDGVFTHPTLAEGFNTLFFDLDSPEGQSD